MPEPIFWTLFATMMVMVFTWFGLVSWLHARLRTRHGHTYEAIGSPTLFRNNKPRHTWLLFKYIFRPPLDTREDKALARILIFMRFFSIAYIILFSTLLIGTAVFPPVLSPIFTVS